MAGASAKRPDPIQERDGGHALPTLAIPQRDAPVRQSAQHHLVRHGHAATAGRRRQRQPAQRLVAGQQGAGELVVPQHPAVAAQGDDGNKLSGSQLVIYEISPKKERPHGPF